jgi:hypothetical protein
MDIYFHSEGAAADLASLLPGQLPGLPAADAVYFDVFLTKN